MKNIKGLILVILCCQLSVFSVTAQQLPTINVTNKNNPSDGYIFLANYGTATSGTYYLLILDQQGRIIYAKSFPFAMNGSLLDFKPQPNNRYSFFCNKKSQYYIMDKNFNIINSVSAKNGYATNCHDLFISEDNVNYLIADETRTIDMSQIVTGGQKNAQVTGNVIQGIDSIGNLVFEWKVLDHLPLTDRVGDLTAPAFDFTHTNSIFLDTDSTMLLCNPELNEITKISLMTGDIIWRFGLNAISNEFTFSNDTLGFIFQHYVMRLPNGNITLFDNGLGRFARAVEYKIDEDNKTAKLVFQFRHTPDINGPLMGSVNKLPNGNMFICWGSAAKMTEVDSTGNTVFEAGFPNCTYRALKYDIPNPIAHLISGPSEICEGQTAVYIAASSVNCTYTWTVTNGTIVSGQGTNVLKVRWAASGNGIVRLTKTNSLNYKDHFLVYVKILPGLKAFMNFSQMCKEVRFLDTTSGVVSRYWDFGDSSYSDLSDVRHLYNASGNYQVKLKIINSYGCADSVVHTLQIPDLPIADFSIDSVVCENEMLSVTNLSTNAVTYYWDFGKSMTSNLKNPVPFSYSQAGNYMVKLRVSNSGCVDSMIKSVLVNAKPVIRFGISNICSGGIFKDSTDNVLHRIWDFGDSCTSALPEVEHIFRPKGTYQVKLKVTDYQGCVDSVVQKINIPELPKADFTVKSDVCVDEAISVSNHSTHAETYFWHLGDLITSDLKNPSRFSFHSSGIYTIKLIVTGSKCNDSLSKTITVNPNPKAFFSYYEICKGASFKDSSQNAVSHFWDFGDGHFSVLSEVDHLYNQPGTYLVKLKVSDIHGCTDSFLKSLIIHETPKADFMIDSIICVNEYLTVVNRSTLAKDYHWNLGDFRTSSSKIPEPFFYTLPGLYQVKLIVSDDRCSDSIIKTVFAMPDPSPKFGLIKLSDLTLQFLDSSYIESGNILGWNWDFGDGNTSNQRNPLHTYLMPGNYLVTLCTSSDHQCESCVVKTVSVEETGIGKPVLEPSLSIFPNPGHGIFTLYSSEIADFININDAYGKEMMLIKPDSKTEVIDLSAMPKGLYFVRIRLNNHEQLFKIINQ